MPTHPSRLASEEFEKHCRFERIKGSGPGGQRRNKVQTGIELTHLPSQHKVRVTERRHFEENRKLAIFRLRVVLALEVRDPQWSGPSNLWKSRIRDRKIQINASHADYAYLLSEVFDCLSLVDFEMKTAADKLGCSTSQLIKFLQKNKQASQKYGRTLA